MEKFVIEAEPRTETGRRYAHNVRLQGLVPCNIYGHGDNRMVTVREKELMKLLITPKVYLVEMHIGNEVEKLIIREVQYHPVTDRPLHLDFYRYVEEEPIVMAIPVQIEGHAAGVQAGGKLKPGIRKIRVRGLAKDLPDQLTVNIDAMQIGDRMHVHELHFDNVEIVETPNLIVVSVLSQRAAQGPAAAAAAPAAAPAAGAAPAAAPAADAKAAADKK